MITKSPGDMFMNLKRDNHDYYPFVVEWDVTYRCPQSCVHCYQKNNVARQELNTKEIFCVIDQLNKLGTLEYKISGGDPLVRSDIFEILNYLSKTGARVVLFTSGVLLTKQTCQLLRDLNVMRVETTLLGADAKTHDALSRYPGSFDKICNGIIMLNELNIAQRVKYIQMQQNWHQHDNIDELSKRLGVEVEKSNPYLWCPHNAEEKEIELYRLTRAQQREYFRWQPKIPLTRAPISCGAGKYQLGLTPDGFVLPCGAYTKQYAVGNVREKAIDQIWKESPQLLEYRKRLRYAVTECRACPDKNFCVYCPAVASWCGGDVSKPHLPMCEYARNAHAAYKETR